MLDFQKLSATYQQALLRQVVPFWLKHSRDDQCGGYFDLLSATGEIIEGDKFVSQQAQQVWAFAWLYNTLDGQPTWLEHARHGATFLSQFSHTDTLSCYDQLDRLGRPVAPSTDLIPDCSVVMAYAQLHRATGDDEWGMLTKQTFVDLLERHDEVRTAQAATLGGFRQMRHLSEPIAVLKTLQEIQPLLDEETWKNATDSIVQELLTEFVDRRIDVLREYVLPEGSFVNTPEGRRINVGLTFRAASYLLDFSAESSQPRTSPFSNTNRKLAAQATGWCLRLCEQAWEEAGGGLNQYVDIKQQPILFPDWQQKWAWVHVEALTALLKSYFYTRQPDCLKWFKRIHDYTFHNFPDAKQSGWHLVVDQHSQPVLSVKSTTTVGCFSLIRCLAETAQLLTKCEQVKTKPTGTRTLN
ncbi:AGE family epimerase/isomerase [Spirosoma litoris]